MNIEQFLEYCNKKPFVTEEFPFGPDNLVLKVKGKIFAITDLNETPLKVNLKCDPEQAEILRHKYEQVKPGYHMNKKHWNTVEFDAKLSLKLLKEWIDHSYLSVVETLSKSLKQEVEQELLRNNSSK